MCYGGFTMARQERKELWHQLDNESNRAHEAFKLYMYLAPADRSVNKAWREWSGNPDAKREPPYFAGWSQNFAWPERARAHDHHLELVRERGTEKAIEEEAKKQARAVEKLHYRYHELMAMGYERAMQYLEDDDFVKHMRPSDVVALIKLHFEGLSKLGETSAQNTESTVDWSEDEQRELERIVGEIDAEEEKREEPPSGSEDGEESSEESEDVQE
jgi:hypothetical protein